MYKELKWPKFTEQYEDVENDNKVMRRITRADGAWNWAYDRRDFITSAARTIYRTVRRKLKPLPQPQPYGHRCYSCQPFKGTIQ